MSLLPFPVLTPFALPSHGRLDPRLRLHREGVGVQPEVAPDRVLDEQPLVRGVLPGERAAGRPPQAAPPVGVAPGPRAEEGADGRLGERPPRAARELRARLAKVAREGQEARAGGGEEERARGQEREGGEAPSPGRKGFWRTRHGFPKRRRESAPLL